MFLSLITPATSEPLTLQEAKEHLRVDDDAQNARISNLITMAREIVEVQTHRQIMSATWRLTMDHFPGRLPFWPQGVRREKAWERGRFTVDRAILLKLPPIQSVTSIVYVDTNGTQQTLSPSQYIVDTYKEPGRIAPAYNDYWPDTREQINAVIVTFVAGYTIVPATVKELMYLILADSFEYREGLSQDSLKISPAVERMVWNLRWGDYE